MNWIWDDGWEREPKETDMKPIWKDGKLTVELHKPDEAVLRKAKEIGQALTAMNQETGAKLVEAVDAILGNDNADH